MDNKVDFLRIKIAEELRKLRSIKNVSLTDIVKQIKEKNPNNKIDIATLSRYENGTVLQSLDKLTIILDYYEISLLYFFNQIYENMYNQNKE